MMYSHIKLSDETEITHSQILKQNEIEVHFKRPNENGFDTALCSLPSYEWTINQGYSIDEIREFEFFMQNHAYLLYKYAESGGIRIA